MAADKVASSNNICCGDIFSCAVADKHQPQMIATAAMVTALFDDINAISHIPCPSATLARVGDLFKQARLNPFSLRYGLAARPEPLTRRRAQPARPGYSLPLPVFRPVRCPRTVSMRAFFGALASCGGSGCHPADVTCRLSTAPGFARHRMGAGAMGHACPLFIRRRGVVRLASPRSRQAIERTGALRPLIVPLDVLYERRAGAGSDRDRHL